MRVLVSATPGATGRSLPCPCLVGDVRAEALNASALAKRHDRPRDSAFGRR
ncbi:MAG: hypothetical protein V2G42_07315 [bacterium JZ-2024 1]